METSKTLLMPAVRPKKSETRDFIEFLVKLVLIVTLVRSLFVATFSIPSESMLPRLMVGDYLFVQKWTYGYSRYSFPWSLLAFLQGPSNQSEAAPAHPLAAKIWIPALASNLAGKTKPRRPCPLPRRI